jgi:HPt (histidine-containing phosphotransfer) domain-containing protein
MVYVLRTLGDRKLAAAVECEDRESVKAGLDAFIELGGRDFMSEMVDLLKQQTPHQFRIIDEGLSMNNLKEVQRQAHSMKSSFGNFGARECQRLASAMDLAVKREQLEEFKTHYAQLRRTFGRLLMLLDSLTAHVRPVT